MGFLLALTGFGCATGDSFPAPGGLSPAAAADRLLATDREFGASSRDADLVTSLIRMFHPDVTLLAPGGAVEGRTAAAAALRQNPDNLGSRAEWTPIRAGISADGLHGFTFGYMTMTGPDGRVTPLKYLAYWIRGDSGWRVAAYKRGRRPEGQVALSPLDPALPPRMVAPSPDSQATARFARELHETERAFSALAGRVGLGPAFRNYAALDAMNLGGPSHPGFVIGPDSIAAAVAGGESPGTGSALAWAPDRVLVATSGDLGVTIGTITAPRAGGGEPALIPFFTVWRRQTVGEPWRFVAE